MQPWGKAAIYAGEMWAIGLCLMLVGMLDQQCEVLSTCPLVIFTDSQWVKKMCGYETAAKTNVQLVHAVRKLLEKAKKERDIRIEWVGGHTDLEGNEFADCFAARGSALSKDG